jgi:predicted nucleic-acid-binding protein
MLAIDTNVAVRYLTQDSPAQSTKARLLIDRQDVFVGTTVMIETEWVLRSGYGFTRAQVCAALRAFAGLPRVVLEDAALIEFALQKAEAGMDFADALHLGRAVGCEAFVTFDRKLIKVARALGARNVRIP